MASFDTSPFGQPDNDLNNFWGKDEPTTAPGLPAREEKRESLVQMQDFGAEISTDYEQEEAFTLDDLLNHMLDMGASDLHLSARTKPMIRINGDVTQVESYPILTGPQIQNLMYAVMNKTQQNTFEKTHELDFAHSIPGRSRFRVNVLRQREQTGAVIRGIPNIIKPIEALGLSEELNKFAYLPRGLVLVTGPTGSGKSTTLAAIIDNSIHFIRSCTNIQHNSI